MKSPPNYPPGYRVKAVLFWAQILAIAIPLISIWSEYRQKPMLDEMADRIVRPIIRLSEEGKDPVPRSELVYMFNHVDEMVQKLQVAEQRRDLEAKVLRNEKTIRWLMIAGLMSILLRIAAYIHDTRLAFAKIKAEASAGAGNNAP